MKEGENAWYYINQGYKVHIPKGFVIYANTGEIIKDKNYKTQEDIIHELRNEIEDGRYMDLMWEMYESSSFI